MWSHLELSYFRTMVPADAILDPVVERQPAGVGLLREEILLTTPSAFVLPRGRKGSADRQASLEYIEVQSTCLGEYREVMRDYIGHAAARLVRANRIGTFELPRRARRRSRPAVHEEFYGRPDAFAAVVLESNCSAQS